MSTTEATEEAAAGETTEETQEVTSEETTETEGEQSTEDGDEGDELPEPVKKKLAKANGEAAKYRTQLREVQEKLQGAKTPEEVAAITAELTDSNTSLVRELAVEKALRQHGLEDGDSVFLTATTAEDIAKQAAALSSRFGRTPGKLRGGLDASDDGDADDLDPASLAKKVSSGRYF